MHLAFVDIARDYAANRIDEDQPFGGTNMAVCYMARELKKLGVSSTLFNKITEPRTADGITALPLELLAEERHNPKYSAFIFCGRWAEWLVKMVREATQAPLIAWMHESLLVPPTTAPLETFDGIIFVSEWQKRINFPYTHTKWRQTVIRNGMNPRIAALYRQNEPILASKSKPLILMYAGVTQRGSFHIPPILDELRKLRSDFSMEIYCDSAPSSDAQANAAYMTWMRQLRNVTHVGQVGHNEFARRFKRASILVSPNPWPETSCVSMIEALASGLRVITTNRAVLPETAAGFAQHIAIDDIDHPTRFDMPVPFAAFAQSIGATMDDLINNPERNEKLLSEQVNYFISNYQWLQRAQPFIDFVRSFGRC